MKPAVRRALAATGGFVAMVGVLVVGVARTPARDEEILGRLAPPSTVIGTASSPSTTISPEAEAARKTYWAMVGGLCSVRHAVERGSAAEAEQIFTDQVHALVHRLADEVAGRDRANAARLQQAKVKLETAFQSGAPTVAIVDALAREVNASLTTLGGPDAALACGSTLPEASPLLFGS